MRKREEGKKKRTEERQTAGRKTAGMRTVAERKTRGSLIRHVLIPAWADTLARDPLTHTTYNYTHRAPSAHASWIHRSLSHTHTHVLKYCLFSCNTKVNDFFFLTSECVYRDENLSRLDSSTWTDVFLIQDKFKSSLAPASRKTQSCNLVPQMERLGWFEKRVWRNRCSKS